MKATISPSTGYFIVGGTAGEPVRVSCAVAMTPIDVAVERPVLSLVQDWEVIEASNAEAVMQEARRQESASRAIALLKLGLITYGR